MIERIGEISGTIAGAVEEQTAVVAEIARSALEAARGTDEVDRAIAGVNEANKGTSAGADELRGAAQEMADVATRLDGLVGTFTI